MNARPYLLALATLSHSVASTALCGLALWLGSFLPEIRPLALPAYAVAMLASFGGMIGAALLAKDCFDQFARLTAAPLNSES